MLVHVDWIDREESGRQQLLAMCRMRRDVVSRSAQDTQGGPLVALTAERSYLMPITIESGPTSGSTRVDEKPASRIQPAQSAPV